MQELPKFDEEFLEFVVEKARKQANDGISHLDISRSEFSMKHLQDFSYNSELEKFQKSNPLLLAALIGTLSKEKVNSYDDICRKGFGGPNKGQDVDLLPCVVQTMSRIVKNRHPRSVNTIPCLNSLVLWANRANGHIYHFFNSLGDSLRYFQTNHCRPIWCFQKCKL